MVLTGLLLASSAGSSIRASFSYSGFPLAVHSRGFQATPSFLAGDPVPLHNKTKEAQWSCMRRRLDFS